MIDISQTIISRSDQTNADDLIGRSLTIKITKVSLVVGEQPVIINFENDDGKPYKPGKSMRRVLAHVWGADGAQYIGRSLTLYRDDKVAFGGLNVGGLRISHMSHIDRAITLVLTASRNNKKPFIVEPLALPSTGLSESEIEALKITGTIEAKKGSDALKAWWGSLGGAKHKQLGAAYLEAIKAIAADTGEIDPAISKMETTTTVSKTETVPLLDRVNSMVAVIEMDKENFGTDDYENVLESESFKALWKDVKASGDKTLLGKISAAMQGDAK